jgi:hypothetical protein
MNEGDLICASIGREGGNPPDTPAALLRSLSRGNDSMEPQAHRLLGVLFYGAQCRSLVAHENVADCGTSATK